jgi:hypothetical protein
VGTTPDIDEAFIMQFGADVHEAYQRMGSKLRNTVRNRGFGTGEKTRFQKVGLIDKPGPKSRNGNIPILNMPHDYVDLTVADAYGGVYTDSMDLLKTNIDERGLVARQLANAFGRATDDVITTAFYKAEGSGGSRKYNSSTAIALTNINVLKVMEDFNTNEVPDDGTRTWVVSPAVWTKLMQIQEFVDADYVGSDDLPWKGGMTAKRWAGFLWFPYTGLSTDGGGDVRTMVYNSASVGFGWIKEVGTIPSWENEKQAWLIAGSMSNGSTVIDKTGALEVVVDITP